MDEENGLPSKFEMAEMYRNMLLNENAGIFTVHDLKILLEADLDVYGNSERYYEEMYRLYERYVRR